MLGRPNIDRSIAHGKGSKKNPRRGRRGFFKLDQRRGVTLAGTINSTRKSAKRSNWAAGSRPQAQCLFEPVSNRKARYRDPATGWVWGF